MDPRDANLSDAERERRKHGYDRLIPGTASPADPNGELSGTVVDSPDDLLPEPDLED